MVLSALFIVQYFRGSLKNCLFFRSSIKFVHLIYWVSGISSSQSFKLLQIFWRSISPFIMTLARNPRRSKIDIITSKTSLLFGFLSLFNGAISILWNLVLKVNVSSLGSHQTPSFLPFDVSRFLSFFFWQSDSKSLLTVFNIFEFKLLLCTYITSCIISFCSSQIIVHVMNLNYGFDSFWVVSAELASISFLHFQCKHGPEVEPKKQR